MIRLLLVLAAVSLSLAVSPSQAQQAIPALGHRDVAFVAATPHFRFHSDFWLNLHDYLYGLAGGGPGERYLEPEATACFEALPADERQRWDDAVAFYQTETAERHHRRDALLRVVRYRMANLAPVHVFDPEADALVDRLRGVAPAYRACLWDAHDARNRARISDYLDHAVRHGPAVAARLGGLYDSGWPESVVVDVVSYANGANTAGGRGLTSHTMISSVFPDMGGFSGFELLFHEASHLVFGPNHGAVSAALRSAADSLGAEMPWMLWHAVSFHTSGRVVEAFAASDGVPYEPYWLRQNIFADYHVPIITHWEPYLNGDVSMGEAARALIQALQN